MGPSAGRSVAHPRRRESGVALTPVRVVWAAGALLPSRRACLGGAFSFHQGCPSGPEFREKLGRRASGRLGDRGRWAGKLRPWGLAGDTGVGSAPLGCGPEAPHPGVAAAPPCLLWSVAF